jgi:hypothetical protein
MNEWFGIKILEKFNEDDITFLNRMFNRRHLVIHTGNRVDEEYIKNTGDTTVRLNQVIRINIKAYLINRACGFGC